MKTYRRVAGYFVHWVDAWKTHAATNHKMYPTRELAQDYLNFLQAEDDKLAHPTTTMHLEIEVAYKW